MAGHVVTVRKGVHKIILETGRDPQTGRRTRRKITFRGTRKQAEEELIRLEHQLLYGGLPRDGSLTVGDYLLRWLDDYGRPRLAPSTLYSYERIIRAHLVPALGRLKLSDLRPMHIQSYYSRALRDGRRDGSGGLSQRTVQYHHRVLREALHHAVRWQLLTTNPADAVEAPKPPRPELQVLDVAGFHKLLSAAEKAEHPDRDLIETAVMTGKRLGELLGLTWPQVDLDAATARVSQTLTWLPGQGWSLREPKSRRSRRLVVLPTRVVQILRRIKERQAFNKAVLGDRYHDHGFVFCHADGRPLDPSLVSRRFRKLADSAGFPRLRFHDLRHTHATLLFQQGVHPKIVQERLGHETISITMDTYSHILPGMQEAAVAQLEDALEHDGHQLGTKMDDDPLHGGRPDRGNP